MGNAIIFYLVGGLLFLATFTLGLTCIWNHQLPGPWSLLFLSNCIWAFVFWLKHSTS